MKPLYTLALCLLPLATAGCAEDSAAPEIGSWQLVSTHSLGVAEPSGLCLAPDGLSLYTVSDETGLVYQLDLDGHTLGFLPFTGEDLEGICLDPDGQGFWLAEERRRQAVHISAEGTVIARFPVDLGGAANSGIEGIAFDGDGTLCLLNEKDPGLLLRRQAADGRWNREELRFARDYSDLCWDETRQGLWVLSDEDESLHLMRAGKPLRRYSLELPRLEGVAVSADTVWVVSDSHSKLYRLQLD